MFYLRPKVMRQSVPNLVEDMDIYKFEPWQLPRKTEIKKITALHGEVLSTN